MNHLPIARDIIRAYDIRGTYQKNLKEEDGFFIGRAFGSYLREQGKSSVGVGYDGRYSSPLLSAKLIQGLLQSGIEVYDFASVPTPFVYFGIQKLNLDAGISVTGSHNPKDDNGFKISLKERPFYGDDLVHLLDQQWNTPPKGEVYTSLKQIDIAMLYLERLRSFFKEPLSYRVAFDTGHGIVGKYIKSIADIMVKEAHFLYDIVDSNFPAHAPDPSDSHALNDLKRYVLENTCDFGIAFDGDGDRLGVVLHDGTTLLGDQLGYFFANVLLKSLNPLCAPNPTFLFDVKTSKIFMDLLKDTANIILTPSGHSLVKERMKAHDGLFASELSGHFFFKENFGFDDGIYASYFFLKSAYLLKEIAIPTICSSDELRFAYPEDDKFRIIDRIKKNLPNSGHLIDIDGIRFEIDAAWFCLRASNTQSVLSLRFEGQTPHDLAHIIKLFKSVVKHEKTILNAIKDL